MGAVIIALSGKGNSGKTATLKNLMSLLTNKASTIERHELCKPIPKGDEHLAAASLEEMLNGKGDVRAVFCCNGVQIGVTSQGDAAEYIETDLKWMGDCDIYVCAVLSYGGTMDYAKRFAAINGGQYLSVKRIHITPPGNTSEALYDTVNITQSENLLRVIDFLITLPVFNKENRYV